MTTDEFLKIAELIDGKISDERRLTTKEIQHQFRMHEIQMHSTPRHKSDDDVAYEEDTRDGTTY